VAQVVIDPEVPDDFKRELESASASELIPFSVPPSRTASLRNAAARQARARKRVLALVSGIWALLLLVLFVSMPTHNARGVLVGCSVVFASMLVLIAVWVGADRGGWHKRAVGSPRDERRKAGLRAHAVIAYHRRYVVPDRDLHGDALSLWYRVSSAADTIQGSEAVRAGLIDSIEASVVLPHHLWEVAERLALLSWPESEQQRIVRQRRLDINDPDVRFLLDRQHRRRDRAIADIEQRIRALEQFAELAVQAEAALERRRGIEELAGLDPEYEELEARLGGSENVLSGNGRLADQLQAVVAEAHEAVRRVNEAARALARPEAG
jgi:hypothetical protein